MYEGLHDSVVDIVGDVDLLIAPVILTCHFEGATLEAISSNRTDDRFLESLKSDVLLNLDNAYRILREIERERESYYRRQAVYRRWKIWGKKYKISRKDI